MAVSVLKKLEISFVKSLGGPEKSRLVALRRREGLSKAVEGDPASCSDSLLLGRLRVEEDILKEHLQRAPSLLSSSRHPGSSRCLLTTAIREEVFSFSLPPVY